MRGRKPMPTALKIKAGVPEGRINRNEPRAEGVPIPPAWLSEGARRAWDRTVPDLIELGVVAAIDSRALALFCEVHASWETVLAKVEEHGPTLVSDSGVESISPYVRIADGCEATMLGLMREFGMTPESRSRIRANPRNEGDELEDFIRTGHAGKGIRSDAVSVESNEF